MRLISDAGGRDRVVSVGIDATMNWLYFECPQFLTDDFEPPPEIRSALRWDQSVEKQWMAWKAQATEALALAGRPFQGADPPMFHSLKSWPDLQVQCVRHWDEFRVWTHTIAEHIDRGLRGAYPAENCEAVRALLPEGFSVSMSVISMRSMHLLDSVAMSGIGGGRRLTLVLTLGLLRDGDALVRSVETFC